MSDRPIIPCFAIGAGHGQLLRGVRIKICWQKGSNMTLDFTDHTAEGLKHAVIYPRMEQAQAVIDCLRVACGLQTLIAEPVALKMHPDNRLEIL